MVEAVLEPPVYDLRGLSCPLPALKTRRKLAAMAPGALLWVETTDPLASIDIPALCAEAGHRLVETVPLADRRRFLIERGHSFRPQSSLDMAEG